MSEQIEKLEHGLMICEATGTELVHIEKADAKKIIGLLKGQKSVIETLKSDLSETLQVLSEQPQIVLCKNCKHGKKHNVNIIKCMKAHDYNPEHQEFHHKNWFCADGERKD